MGAVDPIFNVVRPQVPTGAEASAQSMVKAIGDGIRHVDQMYHALARTSERHGVNEIVQHLTDSADDVRYIQIPGAQAPSAITGSQMAALIQAIVQILPQFWPAISSYNPPQIHADTPSE